jgi:hypothetical protein
VAFTDGVGTRKFVEGRHRPEISKRMRRRAVDEVPGIATRTPRLGFPFMVQARDARVPLAGDESPSN